MSISHTDLGVNGTPDRVVTSGKQTPIRSAQLEAANARLKQLRLSNIRPLRPCDDRCVSAASSPSDKTQQNRQSQWLEGLRKPQIIDKPADAPQKSVYLRLYPSLALGMLREKKTTIGRIWLLARHLDQQGRGWLAVDDLRETLTGKTSEFRVCGQRRLRTLLKAGEEIFWTRDAKGRIWLFSAEKAAHNLHVTRLEGKPIALPITCLLGSIGHLRAAFLNSFHSGRRNNNPISRATIQTISRIPERTQRAYDKQSCVKRTACYALSLNASAEDQKATAWQLGNTFTLVDHQGQHGAQGQRYVTWQLPNQYSRQFKQLALGRQRKINRALRHNKMPLVKLRAQGTHTVVKKSEVERRYVANGYAASKTNTNHPLYWQTKSGIWYALNQK